jgi:hypothetical protein
MVIMTATALTKAQLEVLALDETCPKCSAAPGSKCVSQVPGQPARELTHPHGERSDAAKSAQDSAPDIDKAAAELAASLAETETPPAAETETAEKPEPELHATCVECGYGFKAPQRKSRCQVKAACDKRKAAKASAS